MKIESVRIRSFKSFSDSGWISLARHVTVLVGQNNAGKSAFLQAFDIHTLVGKPHRTNKRPASAGLIPSEIEFKLLSRARS